MFFFLSKVSRLVIIHEEAGDTNAMPDLSVPVGAVSRAVTNLVKVTTDSSLLVVAQKGSNLKN